MTLAVIGVLTACLLSAIGGFAFGFFVGGRVVKDEDSLVSGAERLARRD